MPLFSDNRDGITAQDLLPGIRWQESRGNPNAIGPALPRHGGEHALGMYQILPETARRFGYKPNEMFDPAKAEDAATKYLTFLLHRYNGNPFLAAAAYYTGEGNVDKGRITPDVENYAKNVTGFTGGYERGGEIASARRASIPPASTREPLWARLGLFGSHHASPIAAAPPPSQPTMPPIDYGSLDPSTPLGMLFATTGDYRLNPGEQQTAPAQARPLLQRLFQRGVQAIQPDPGETIR